MNTFQSVIVCFLLLIFIFSIVYIIYYLINNSDTLKQKKIQETYENLIDNQIPKQNECIL